MEWELEIDIKWIFLVVAMIVVLVGVYLYVNSNIENLTHKTSAYRFNFASQQSDMNTSLKNMIESKKVAIIMDVRLANSTEWKKDVYDCGAEFAKGFGMLNKNVSNYAVEYDYCIGPDLSNMTLESCESEVLLDSDYVIYLYATNDSNSINLYYKNSLYVGVGSTSNVTCGFNINSKNN